MTTDTVCGVVDFSNPIIVDFETYYDREYTLRKIPTEEYIRCSKFECIGLAIKNGNEPTQFYKREEWLESLKELMYKYPERPFVAHNANFDMGILGLRYGIHPRFTIDTMMLAKFSCLDRVAGGASLAKLADALIELGYGIPPKGTEVYNMQGVRANYMTNLQWRDYGNYCKLDVELARVLYDIMLPNVMLHELEMAHLSTEMFTKAYIQLDVPLLVEYKDNIVNERERRLSELATQLRYKDTNSLLSDLRSSPKFFLLLERLGVEPPTKWSEKQNKFVPATAKTDDGLQELLNHPEQLVRDLVELKLSVSSSIERTRAETFIGIATRGRLPIPLRYAATHTGRYGGCIDSLGVVKVKSPDDKIYAKYIYQVEKDDLVWDGNEFVTHNGVEYRGVQTVIQHGKLTATPDHLCWDNNSQEWKPLSWFVENGVEVAVG